MYKKPSAKQQVELFEYFSCIGSQLSSLHNVMGDGVVDIVRTEESGRTLQPLHTGERYRLSTRYVFPTEILSRRTFDHHHTSSLMSRISSLERILVSR